MSIHYNDISMLIRGGSVKAAGVYILVENGYLFPPPSEIYIFSPKKQRDFRATLPTTK
jgi:hypothetical protein